MFGHETPLDSTPLFVLATRLFVHYKFKTRKTFDPSAMLIDDAYAREVLAQIRSIPDARLKTMADAFEMGRFGAIVVPAAPPKADGGLDLPLGNEA